MRHLVYLLVVANLAYLGWNVFTAASGQVVAPGLPPLPDTAVRLVTVQEQRAAMAHADEVSAIEQSTAAQPPGAGVTTLCQAMGPFLVLEEMQAVEKHLLGMGLTPAPRHLEEKELTGYWVYLPSMSREQVQQVTAVLEEHHDKEYYVGKKDFISLGTFRGVERARRRLQQVRDMGLDARLDERFKEQNSWWLDIQSDGSARDSLLGIVDRHQALQLVDLAC